MLFPKKLSLLVYFCLCVRVGCAQHYVEVRGADTKYRYFDWNYTFANSAVVDAFYVGVPGSNEFNLGGGYGFKPKPSLTLTPLAYAVIGKEEGQRGIKLSLLLALDKEGWRVNGFVGHYVPISGDVARYQVLDTLDASRLIDKRWEIGVSSGFYHADRKWNPQVGPLVKWNDRLGSWNLSYRFGPQRELRVSRVLLFKK
jgi:hypothetical protein